MQSICFHISYRTFPVWKYTEYMRVDWIRQQIEKSGISQGELAKSIGLTDVQLSKVLTGYRVLQSSEADAIRRYFGLELPEDEIDALTRVELNEKAPPNAKLVPVFDVEASAGHGSLVEYEPQAYSLAFPPAYLRSLTSSSPANLAIISVKGESMEPTLLDNDIVLLDVGKTSLAYDGLFVLKFDGALHVKRVGRSPKQGFVTVISDNSTLFPPMEFQISDVDVVGKVLWYGRKV